MQDDLKLEGATLDLEEAVTIQELEQRLEMESWCCDAPGHGGVSCGSEPD